MEGTIKFRIIENTSVYVFRKGDFKKITTSYSTGKSGSVIVYFQAENDLINHDYMTLTVRKEYMEKVVDKISEFINTGGHDMVEVLKGSTGLFGQIYVITYTAGTA